MLAKELKELKKVKPTNLLMLTLAGVINAFGVTIFIAPVNLYDSGVSGTGGGNGAGEQTGRQDAYGDADCLQDTVQGGYCPELLFEMACHFCPSFLGFLSSYRNGR